MYILLPESKILKEVANSAWICPFKGFYAQT